MEREKIGATLITLNVTLNMKLIPAADLLNLAQSGKITWLCTKVKTQVV